MGHGGLLGLSESVYVGLPMILVPIYGDQFHNSAAAETRGAAVVVAYDDLTEETLRSALDKVFNDTRYAFSFCFNPKMRNLFLTQKKTFC